MIFILRYFAQKALDFTLSAKANKMTNVFNSFVIGQYNSLVVFIFFLLGNKNEYDYV